MGIKFCKEFFEHYGWTVVGKITPTDKKARADKKIPFLKLSKSTINVGRGWYREAVIEMKTATGKTYYNQCTTWRDKKQGFFLSANKVGFSHRQCGEILVLLPLRRETMLTNSTPWIGITETVQTT